MSLASVAAFSWVSFHTAKRASAAAGSKVRNWKTSVAIVSPRRMSYAVWNSTGHAQTR